MTDLPSPLTGLDCDLKAFPFMPVEIMRLFNSEFHAQANDSEWRAGMTLWLKSWHQVPAASIPNDDIALARLAELGRDVKSWKKLRERALHGWVLCDDGRLYHPVVAQKAIEAMAKKKAQQERTTRARLAALKKRLSQNSNPEDQERLEKEISSLSLILKSITTEHVTKYVTESVTDAVTETNREGEGEGEGEGIIDISLTSFEIESAQSKTELNEDRTNPVPRVTKPKGKTNGTRLSDDWQPSAEDQAYASSQGYAEPDIQRIAESFRDYWIAQAGAKGIKRDWAATWRTWCRNQERFNPGSSRARSLSNQPGRGSIAAAALAVMRQSSPISMGSSAAELEQRSIPNSRGSIGHSLPADHQREFDHGDHPMLSGDGTTQPGRDGFADDDRDFPG